MDINGINVYLKKTLEFYSEPKNYTDGKVQNDGGHMARFVLEEIKKMEEEAERLEKVFDTISQAEIDKMSPDQVTELYKQLKGIK